MGQLLFWLPFALKYLYSTVADSSINHESMIAVQKLKKSYQDAPSDLTDQDMQIARKVYKKRFRDTQVYKVKGTLSYYFNIGSGISYHLLDKLRIETVYQPFTSDSLEEGKFSDGTDAYVEMEGIIHNHRFYVIKFNNFNVIQELSTSLSLPRTYSASIDSAYNLVSGTLMIITISLISEFAVIGASGRSWWFSSMMVLIGLFFHFLYLKEAYYSKYQHIVEGEFTPRNDIYGNCYQSNRVGMLGDVLIYTDYPLVAGKKYRALGQSKQFFLPPFPSLYIDKVNGFEYKHHTHDKKKFQKSALFLCMMTCFLLSSAVYLSRLIPDYLKYSTLYHHNVEKFGEHWARPYRDAEYSGLDYIEIGDYINIFDSFDSYDHSYLRKKCKDKKSNSINRQLMNHVFYTDFSSGYKFVLNSDYQANLSPNQISDYLKSFCQVKPSYEDFTLVVFGPNYDSEDGEYFKGTVSKIDHEHKTIYFDKHDLDLEYGDISSRLSFASLFFLMIFIRFSLQVIELRNMQFLLRKDRNSDKTWV